MDLSALERDVKALESSLESIEFWVTVSTVLVVVGLVVEYWFPLCELVESLRNRPPFPWNKLFEMIGGVLVTVGVAGELWFQSRASNKQAFIRSDSHQIEGLLNKEAGDARKDAGVAIEHAKALESENLKLQAQIQPRELTPAQLGEIKRTFRPFVGRMVVVMSYAGDLESLRFALQIRAALLDAGMDKTALHIEGLPTEALRGTRPRYGVQIGEGANGDKALLLVLSRWLKPNTRLDISDLAYPVGSANPVIFVGAKPFPQN